MKTIYNIAHLTQAVEDLAKQGQRSDGQELGCVYNSKIGERNGVCEYIHCIIGHMIKYDVYAQKRIKQENLNENTGVGYLICKGVIGVDTKSFGETLKKAQYIHDNIKIADWSESFGKLLQSNLIE